MELKMYTQRIMGKWISNRETLEQMNVWKGNYLYKMMKIYHAIDVKQFEMYNVMGLKT